jgi:hypothetical protein
MGLHDLLANLDTGKILRRKTGISIPFAWKKKASPEVEFIETVRT